MRHSETCTLIRNSKLLKNLTPEECMQFIDAGQPRHLKSGTFLFHQENAADFAYFVLEGKVRLAQLTPSGKRVVMDIISAGRYVGLFVALTRMTYPASGKVIDDSFLYGWKQETLRDLMLGIPRLALNSMELIAKRFVRLQDRVQMLATERVEQRVAHALMDVSEFVGTKSNDGSTINMSLSHQDLAEMAGTNIYSISRVLNKWEESDIVAIGRQRISLCNLNHLKLLAEGG